MTRSLVALLLLGCVPAQTQAPMLDAGERNDVVAVGGEDAPDGNDVVAVGGEDAPDASDLPDDGAGAPNPDAPSDEPVRDIWCAAQWPLETTAQVGTPTEPLYARTWVEGVTPSNGADPVLEVEFALGDPGVDPGRWSGWVVGAHNAQCDCGNDDEFMARLTPATAGEHAWAARVRYEGDWVYCDRADPGRDGSSDGWSARDAPTVRATQLQSLRVVTLNLRCLLDDWDARLPVIVETLAALEPDLVGFQEVCREPGGRDGLAELSAALTQRTGALYHTRFARSHWSWDQYDEGVGMLSPHRLSDLREVDLPAGAFGRKLLAARALTPRGPVLFATTHLDHQSPEARGAQVAVVVDALDRLGQDDEPRVLTGDLNETPGGGVASSLRSAGLIDAWAEVGAGSGHTFPASRPRARIDYIWIGGGLTPSEATVLFDGAEASDHLGVSARLD